MRAIQDLTIITVNYNGKEDTVRLVRSLLAAGAVLDQVIIVDNHSENDSTNYIQSAFPEPLTILCSPQNLGYAHGLNLGLEHFLKQNKTGWALLINNDTTVAEDFLSALVETAEKEEYTLLGPVIFYMDDPERIWGSGDVLLPGTLIGCRRYRGSARPAPQARPVPVDILNGCAMFVHRSVFVRIGMFDPTFFMYAEEVDFCWRARRAGFSMAVVPGASMWHKVSASANAMREQSLFFQIRNQIKFYRRYSSGAKRLVMFLFSTLRNFFACGKYLLAKKPVLAGSVLKGWKSGWFE